MAVAIFAMRLLEVLFFVGIAGSSIVVLISSVEDIHELFGKRDHTVTAIDENQSFPSTSSGRTP